MGTNRREFFIVAAAAAAVPFARLARAFSKAQDPAPCRSPFELEAGGGGITSLRFARDTFSTNYVASGQALGHVHVTWRRLGGAWQQLRSEDVEPGESRTLPVSGLGIAAEYLVKDEAGEALAVAVRLQPQGDLLHWRLALRNPGASPVEVGDLSLPLPMHSSFDAKESPTASVLKHSFISGHGSYLFWMRSNSVGPYLVMTPEPGTPLEYWDHTTGRPPQAHGAGQTQGQQRSFRAYVHSAAVAESIRAAGGRWRQPHTSLTMAPGEEKVYGFQFAWALDYSGVRDRLVRAGLIDVDVAPGMTIPSDLLVWVAIRSTDEVQRLEAEHPAQTIIEPMADRGGRKLYRVRFRRLGENMLTVRQAGGRATYLEFFATEPVETLLHKRAAFITKHQVRDASKWYNGLFGEWAMDTRVQLARITTTASKAGACTK